MAFVRTKKIGGKSYGYLVENRWEDGRAKQTVTQYLGRVHELPKIGTTDVDISNHSFINAVHAIIGQELCNHGFVKSEQGFVRDGVMVNTTDWNIVNKGKPAVLRINDGYLCSHTLRQLINFNPGDQDAGFALARRLVEAGIALPKENFVKLYEKTQPEAQVQ